ncbi:MAG: D-alanine--D-alanine ligase [Rhodospirillaceae bacterium]|nr:D-alanine--D-alanine ligase [Rhodospirillaceae bacterium]
MTKAPLVAKPRPNRSWTGPVADLESHLPAEWWRELFDALYLRTDGDVVENDANTQREIDLLIAATGIKPSDRVLDLCCGQGRHVLELARRGYTDLIGVDRSRYLVRLARRRATRLGRKVLFREGDARSFRVRDGLVDCVAVMGNSFGYFADENDDRKVLESIKRSLVSEGQVALDITDGDWMREHFEPRSWEWIDQNHFVCRERSLSADRDRLISREVVVHAERGVIADQFYAERLYSHDRIVGLIEEAGFKGVQLHDTVEAHSDRGQDLGMMAHRIFLTAVAPRKAAPKARTRPITNVTVLLGDPRLPDTVKKGGRFNEEDFETVQRLKEALAEIDGFKFDYLDSHPTLIADLRAKRPDLVLNLCDEGFANDAFKELHIPAILEMLDLPYTGAGPACLSHCYDKALVRAVAAALDIPTPVETYMRSDDQSATIPSVFPALIKPNFGDSSIGIVKEAVIDGPEALLASLTRIREMLPGRPVLVQEFLQGREYTVGLLGNPATGLRSLPILEVDYSRLDPGLPPILGYESKWLPESPYWTQVAYKETDLDGDSQRVMIQNASILFERLGCRDYARFDFRADAEGNLKLLEVNPNPGWCWDGKMNLMAGFAGMSYTDMLRAILEAALDRTATARETASVAA